MAITTTCPSCQGPLRIPDELLGQQVRCPVCQNIFDAVAPTPAAPPSSPEPDRPLWKDLQLDLDKSDPARPSAPAESESPTPTYPPPRAEGRPGRPALVGAVEVTPSGDQPAVPRRPAAPPAPPPPPRRPQPSGPPPRQYPDDYDDDYRGPRRGRYDRRPYRRDTEPHRGVLILVLGIISVVFVALSFCTYGAGALVGLPLGITSWVMGHGDLQKIKDGVMDEEGLGMTQAGWICGIIGTILTSLIVLSCGAFIAVMLVAQANAGRP